MSFREQLCKKKIIVLRVSLKKRSNIFTMQYSVTDTLRTQSTKRNLQFDGLISYTAACQAIVSKIAQKFSKFFCPKKNWAWIPLRKVTLQLPYFNFFIEKNLLLYKTDIRSILTKLTYDDGSHFPGASQSAGTANWTQECRSQNCTLNSKCNKCCKWTCCSDLPI